MAPARPASALLAAKPRRRGTSTPARMHVSWWISSRLLHDPESASVPRTAAVKLQGDRAALGRQRAAIRSLARQLEILVHDYAVVLQGHRRILFDAAVGGEARGRELDIERLPRQRRIGHTHV